MCVSKSEWYEFYVNAHEKLEDILQQSRETTMEVEDEGEDNN